MINSETLLRILKSSVEIMMEKLTKSKTKEADANSDIEASPDFAEMGEAIEDLIGEESSDQTSNVEISENHQLILACAWLNLKECSLVAAQLAKTLGVDPSTRSRSLTPDQVEDCLGIMISVLTRCRHKGAIEATHLAIQDLCTTIFEHGAEDYKVIVEKSLIQTLGQIESFQSSVTRRSAGLPMLIQKIVASEPKFKTRKLLDLSIKRLLEIAQRKSDKEISDTKDVGPAHAMHVLKVRFLSFILPIILFNCTLFQALVHESSLAHDISRYLPDILRLCVKSFGNDHWAVRNSALQVKGKTIDTKIGWYYKRRYLFTIT